jgi:SAM-dependent methyltransferase
MNFGSYSKYYNLLYADKDYAGEARYVHRLIQKYRPGARSILNLGCGTGNHDFEFSRLGYEVVGVDLSADMLAVAASRLSSLGTTSAPLEFLHGDIRGLSLERTFDVVVSLFHVMSYQTTNDDLQSAFGTASRHLKPEGLFLFDCWYGPAVLTDPPVVRIKRLEDDQIKVLRIAEPVMHHNRNVVDVNYQICFSDKVTGTSEELTELHSMRYFFMPEVAGYCGESGLRILQAEEWLSGREPGNGTWSVCFVGSSSA